MEISPVTPFGAWSNPEVGSAAAAPPPTAPPAAKPGGAHFADVLRQACEQVGCRTKFSGHAQARVISREVKLDPDQLRRIDRAVDAAAAKGAKTALVMLDDMALIVGVQPRTVITLVGRSDMQGNVFTAIDTAVIA